MSPDADPPPPDFGALVAAVRAGDQAAARALVEHLHPQVIRIVRARRPRRVGEEDLAQDVFLKMFARLDQYRGDVPLPHWVSRIAVTTCIDALRAQQRRPELRMADLGEAEAQVLAATLTRADAADPADALAAHELLYKLLDQLDPKDRTIIQLLDLEQKSLTEIHALTGWNTTLVKVRAFRARQKLRKLLEKLQAQERRPSPSS
jgi:RNA polymerase sigma factor (sigma-70 family)